MNSIRLPGRAKLAAAHPALMVAFDLLVDESRRDLTAEPLTIRRERLDEFARAHFAEGGRIALSPATRDAEAARAWLGSAGGAFDGVLAKRLEEPYRSGERTGMVKVKHLRSADCVVAGFRRSRGGAGVGSLLLGLYDEDGLLHHVGFTSSFSAARRTALLGRLESLGGSAERGAGFTGRAPGGGQPLEPGGAGVDAPPTGTGGGGGVRPRERRAFPPRHAVPAMAPGQGAVPVHRRPAPRRRARSSLIQAAVLLGRRATSAIGPHRPGRRSARASGP